MNQFTPKTGSNDIQRMKAVGVNAAFHFGINDPLINLEIDIPTPTQRDILVKIEAISVNPVDTKVRKRHAAQQPASELNPPEKILGWDAAGTVVAVGDMVTQFQVGDEVWYAGALDRPGCNSEYHLVDERLVGHKPVSLTFAEAAALPLTGLTAWEMLFDRLQIALDDNHSLLIIGAAGGVGSIMVQLARHLTQKSIIGTASRPDSQAWVSALGAHHVINHHQSLAPQIQLLHLPSVNHIVSLNQTEKHLNDIVEIIAPQGKFGLIDDPNELDIKAFKQKSISIHWEFMYTRSLFKTEDMSQQKVILNQLASLIDQDIIKPTGHQHFGKINAKNLMKAHEFIETQAAIGKVVLEGF